MSQFWINFIAQAIGILAFISGILSYQFKKNKTFLLFQLLFVALMSTQFAILKAWGGCVLNGLAIFRALIFAFKDRNNKRTNQLVAHIFCLLFLIGAIITVRFFNEHWYLAIGICFAQMVGSISFASDDAIKMRKAQLYVVSPLWLINDIFYFSIGGIIAELFTMISAIISLIRFREKKII